MHIYLQELNDPYPRPPFSNIDTFHTGKHVSTRVSCPPKHKCLPYGYTSFLLLIDLAQCIYIWQTAVTFR